MNKRVILIILIIIAAVGFLLFSDLKEKSVAKNDQEVSGQTVEGEYDFPTDWPEELPIPDAGIIVGGKADLTSLGDLKQYTVDMIWTIEDYNAYAGKCIEAGYTETMNGIAEAEASAEKANWMGKNPDTGKIIYIYFLAKDTDNSGNNEIWFGN